MPRTRSKRQKTIPKDPQEDEDLPTAHSMANAPSSSVWSMRQLPSKHPPPLIMLCIRVFASNFRQLAASSSVMEAMKERIKLIPDSLIPRLLAGLRETCPTFLAPEFISTYLLRGPVLRLGDDLPGVGKATILAIPRLGSPELLRELALRGLQKIPDDTFATVIAKLPKLQVLNLRECTKVGPKTAEAIATNCPLLSTINFSYTAVSPIALAPIIRNCHNLEVLKVAGIPNWTDANVTKLWRELNILEDTAFRLPKIRTLKLRQTSITEVTLATVLEICPNIQRLDISFTGVRRPPPHLSNTTIEKLSLTSTKLSSADLLKTVCRMTSLRTIAIGAMGRGEGSAAVVSNASAMTLTDNTLGHLTHWFTTFEKLENVNIAGNLKLGTVTHSVLTDFVNKMGRKCKTLNMAGVPNLRSSDLKGLLVNEDQEPSPLEVLVLNSTSVDDNAAVFISCCPSLRVLELASTKFTNAGLFTILDACKQLEGLNLTACRGIKIAHRRSFFEVYEREHLLEVQNQDQA